MAFISGLFGYLVAIVAFLWIGLLIGHADPADSLGAGLAVAYLIALSATVAVLVTALRARRRGRPIAGSLAGMAVGLILMALLAARIQPVAERADPGCPCEAIIDQIVTPRPL
ncbi:hypothetical protein [Actinoplanes utahensis]|nr:hypothetical protein [Actinoplanes utahensis]GIF31610.1 hypothetical protein Aut01nite_45960 [Actinoplanes utahensis]